MKKVLTIAMVIMALMLSTWGCVFAAGERIVSIGGEEYHVRAITTQTSEGYAEKVSMVFGFDKDGNMVVASADNGVMPRLGIVDDGTFVGGAFRWDGILNYERRTIDGQSCYRPISYTHEITVLEDMCVLKSLVMTGGYYGMQVDADGNELFFIQNDSVNRTVNNPGSGTGYSKSYGMSNYLVKDPGSFIIRTSGHFTYQRGSASTATSPTFELVIE